MTDLSLNEIEVLLLHSSYFSRSSGGSSSNITINILLSGPASSTFKHSNPKLRRIHRSLSFMHSRPNISKEVVDMTHDDAHNFFFRDVPMHEHIESHENPRQVRSSENEHTEKTQSSIRISS